MSLSGWRSPGTFILQGDPRWATLGSRPPPKGARTGPTPQCSTKPSAKGARHSFKPKERAYALFSKEVPRASEPSERSERRRASSPLSPPGGGVKGRSIFAPQALFRRVPAGFRGKSIGERSCRPALSGTPKPAQKGPHLADRFTLISCRSFKEFEKLAAVASKWVPRNDF